MNLVFFFFKQKTAYEMRISDWSSDVCSSDLIERTLFTLRWFDDPALRRTVTAELNKGEARNSLARAVAFHRLGRFRDRGLENQQTRAAALNLVTAAIILFNCRHLGHAVEEMRRRGSQIDPAMLSRLSPWGWDRINLSGAYFLSHHPHPH